MRMTSRRLVAVDWGSSTLRAALLDADDGSVRDERSSACGMLEVSRGEGGADGGFDAVFEAQLGDWMDVAGTRCLMAGMVGSRQGWVEAEYVRGPCGVDELVARLRRVGSDASRRARDIAIVPGATCVRDDGVPDVLRGEEVKVLGALALLGNESAVVVSPGTHCKWMIVERGRLVRFATAMTGEVYALLSRHSILARSLPPPAAGEPPFDGAAFDAGVRRALAGCGLLQTAFGVRTRSLFEDVAPAALASHLSGLVIGEELRCRPLDGVTAVALVGAPLLTERYRRALAVCGVAATAFGQEAVWRGLWEIDRRRARGAAAEEGR